MSKNYFKELELNLDATAEDVRTAYKRLAKQWHPDKNKAEGAEDRFKRVLEAYNHLQSDDRREVHARELRKTTEIKKDVAPHPPQNPKPNKPSASSKANDSKSSPSSHDSNDKEWQDSFKKKAPNKDSKSRQRPKSSKSFSERQPGPPPDLHSFFNSFMSFSNFMDPFDEIIFDIFMVGPKRPPPKPKTKTDPFGNKLPENIDGNLYDWKSATKGPGKQPDYKEYLDHDTEFTCHYCGMMMNMEMLRKHEPRCQRLGGKKQVPGYEFDDEEINGSYGGGSTPTPTPKANTNRKIRCQWCGASVFKSEAAEHIAQCKIESGNERKPQIRIPKAKPEWNNDFTKTEYPDDHPEDILYGKQSRTSRPKSHRININDFTPFMGSGLSGSEKNCWRCNLEYGTDPPIHCPHIHF